MSAISNDWLEVLSGEFGKPYYKKLYNFILSEYRSRIIYPKAEDIFNAFHLTPKQGKSRYSRTGSIPQ